MSTTVISIANAKGGVGKSTVSILLAGCFSKLLQKKVLILDTDSQNSVTRWFESEKRIYDSDPLVTVESLMPQHVQMYLKKFGDDFDIVFIDVPRMTHGVGESATLQLLYYCDSVLIPVVGSRMDVDSTANFFKVVMEAKAKKIEMGFPFEVFGFLNKESNRKDHQEAKEVLKRAGIDMLESTLRDLKIFTTPSLFECILDTKEGKRRFEPFYNEVTKKLKIRKNG
ncbi:MAG: ParA family protein [Bacteroidota bacterium]